MHCIIQNGFSLNLLLTFFIIKKRWKNVKNRKKVTRIKKRKAFFTSMHKSEKDNIKSHKYRRTKSNRISNAQLLTTELSHSLSLIKIVSTANQSDTQWIKTVLLLTTLNNFSVLLAANIFFLQKIYYELKSDTGKGSGEAADQKFLDFLSAPFRSS